MIKYLYFSVLMSCFALHANAQTLIIPHLEDQMRIVGGSDTKIRGHVPILRGQLDASDVQRLSVDTILIEISNIGYEHFIGNLSLDDLKGLALTVFGDNIYFEEVDLHTSIRKRRSQMRKRFKEKVERPLNGVRLEFYSAPSYMDYLDNPSFTVMYSIDL